MIYIITEEDYSDDSDDKVKQIKFVLSHDFRVPADCLET